MENAYIKVSMIARIKSDIDAYRSLIRASIPSQVIEMITGRLVEVNTSGDFTIRLNEVLTTWNLPSETYEKVVQC